MKSKEQNKPGPIIPGGSDVIVTPAYTPDLPDWIPPVIDDTTRLSPTETREPPEFTFLSADDSIIPEAFGEVVIKPRFASIVASGANILLRCIWCRGEVGSMTVYAGNEVFAGTVTNYVGAASQSVNSALSSAIPGYSDNLNGICYSVVTLPGKDLSLASSLACKVSGRSIADPRTSPTNDSANPALIYNYIATQAGLTVDSESIKTAADYCDQVIPTTSIKRWSVGLLFEEPEKIEDLLKKVAEYAGCYHVRDGGTVRLVPDAATSTTTTFSDDAADIAGGSKMIVSQSLRLTKKRLSALPNQVRVQYTRTSEYPWRRPYAQTATPGGDVRQTTFNMSGFQKYNTALRFATERKNKYASCDLEISFESFDDALEVQVGDVIEVTHNVGLTDEKFRVIGIAGGADIGRWRINAEKYDATINSDAADAEPSYNTITLPDPSDIPAGPTPITVSDENYVDEMGFTYSRLKIEFNGVSWPFVKAYRVRVYFGTSIILETTLADLGSGNAHSCATGPVSQDVLYTIETYIVNIYDEVGPASSTTKQADGKSVPPSTVTSITAEEKSEFIYLEWTPATDTDLRGYIVKRLAAADYTGAADDAARWSHVNVVEISDRVDTTKLQLANQPTGEYYYGVRAIDLAGNESAASAWDNVTVTENAGVPIAIVFATVYLRKASTPSTPAVDDGEYNFSTLTLTPPSISGGSADDWSVTPPAGTDPLYSSQTTFDILGTTGIDSTCTWSAPVQILANGIDGNDGNSVAQVACFRRYPTVVPGTPTGGSFDFSTNVLTPPTFWSAGVPAGSDPVYVSYASAFVNGTTGVDNTLTWSTPIKFAENGADGSAGDDGISTFHGVIYRRATSTPSAPTGGSFNFGTNTLTPPSLWSISVPAGTDPIYTTSYQFSIVGQTGIDTAGTWATVRLMAQDGADGGDGLSTYAYTVYKRATSTPSTPSGGSYNFTTNSGTPPSTWSNTIPAVNGQACYASTAIASITGPTGTDSSLSWSSPLRIAEDMVGTQLEVESKVFACDSDGTGYSISDINNTNKKKHAVYSGATDITTSATHSIVGGTDLGSYWSKTQNGMVFIYEETTGLYYLNSATGWSSDQETVTLRATYGGVNYDKEFTIAKSKAGASSVDTTPAVSIQGRTINGTTAAGVQFASDGDVDRRITNGGAWSDIGDWWDKTTGSAGDYSVWLQVIDSGGNTILGSTLESWLALSTSRNVYFNNASGVNSATIQASIKKNSTGYVYGTAIFTLNADAS